MKFNKIRINTKTSISANMNTQYAGESLEQKLRRVVESGEPIDMDMTPEIYQERSAGVDPMCDIRTDKMQLAQDACDSITRTHMLARANRGDMGNKKVEEFTYITDTDGNIVKNPIIETSSSETK